MSDATATDPNIPTPPEIPKKSPVEALVDFSDKLSPMLVKELRQGMRTNLFTVAFILLQAFMILCMILGQSGSGGSQFFWFFVIVALLVVQPIRGFGALSSEYSLNTMDLIQLTRLSAWRIAFGKWAAIVAQSLLLLTGTLPYVVMRYFQGGIDLIKDLEGMLYILLGTLLLTAVTVGFSSFKSIILRVALLIGAGIGAMVLGTFVIATRFDAYGMGLAAGAGGGWITVGAIFTVIYATYYLLDLGASRIAPESVNHSSRKRLISLGFILVFLCLPFIGVAPEFCLAVSGVVILLVGIDSITESPSVLTGVLRAFSKNTLTRFSASFLTPGWHTGLRFFVLCSVLFFGALFFHLPSADLNDMEGWIMMASLVASVIFPLLVIHLFFFPVTYSQFYFGLYILIQVCVFAVAFFISIAALEFFGRSTLNPLLYMCFPIPMVNIFAVGAGNNDEFYFLAASSVFLIFSLLVPAIRARPINKRMRQTFVAIREGTDDDIAEQTERQIIPKGAE